MARMEAAVNVASRGCSLATVLPGVIGALLLIGTTTLSKGTDRSQEGLIGPVRELTTISGATTTIATFDRAGALIETISRVRPPADEPDALERVQQLVYVYDAKGRRLREMIKGPDGQQYLSRRYAYDAAGRKRAEAAYHMCGTFSSLHVYSYDARGRLQEDLLYQFRSLTRQVFEHEERGQPKELNRYKNGLLHSTTRFEYDERGNPIVEEVTSSADPSRNAKNISTYDYDKTGNWIRKTTRRFVNVVGQEAQPSPEQTDITERTVTYFHD
jgi:hypothetical protein